MIELIDSILGFGMILVGAFDFMVHAGWAWWFGVLLIITALVTAMVLTLQGRNIRRR